MLKHAFKEWAVICQALALGRQALILRKGGIAESTGDFQLEQTRFWLFPTYAHQQHAGIKPEAVPLLERVQAVLCQPCRLIRVLERTTLRRGTRRTGR